MIDYLVPLKIAYLAAVTHQWRKMRGFLRRTTNTVSSSSKILEMANTIHHTPVALSA